MDINIEKRGRRKVKKRCRVNQLMMLDYQFKKKYVGQLLKSFILETLTAASSFGIQRCDSSSSDVRTHNSSLEQPIKTFTATSYSGVLRHDPSSEQYVYKVFKSTLFTVEEFYRRRKPSRLHCPMMYDDKIYN
ncbi:hypothetical protein EVAR_52130_1 [Eumeta japonica]|uniref:Uncharacterized protein n=1 Tax=Eumeta variegata TaxID=151549 RepID=A0A4C1XN35_EUMVA|nr:hypothetical protein EVAR_52130_1 [Eumeta japonica]